MLVFHKASNTKLSIVKVGMLSIVAFLLNCEKVDLVSLNIVTTEEITFISYAEALGGGSVYNGGKSTVSSRGICWHTEPLPTINNSKTDDGIGTGSFNSTLTGLQANTTYHARAYASNAQGTAYGNNVVFTTNNSAVPVIKTKAISNLTTNSCTSGGVIRFEGSSKIISKGVCWSINYPPHITDAKTIDGDGKDDFTSNITGLEPKVNYYVRAYAINNEGVAYGNMLSIQALKSTVTDIDGNIYNTISIGTQVWTVENLNVTKYRNGEPLPYIVENSVWNTTESGAYCNYDNDSMNSGTYGRLYNWYAVSDIRNIAPKGWHVATYKDYQVLIDYLGGPLAAVDKMKNEGFNAIPGGKRNRDGLFYDKGIYPYFWTATEYHEGSKWARYLVLDEGSLDIINLSKNYGFSVRCERD